MTWIYHQATGDLFHNGTFVGTGYSGKGTAREEGRNNGDMERDHDKGPIPRGRWTIGPPQRNPKTGPVSMTLKPVEKGTALGRSGFLIHGDNAAHNASTGCIILGKGFRVDIAGSGDHDLEVVA